MQIRVLQFSLQVIFTLFHDTVYECAEPFTNPHSDIITMFQVNWWFAHEANSLRCPYRQDTPSTPIQIPREGTENRTHLS